MARLVRIVVPGLPHHVVQRGNGCQRTFFDEGDHIHWRDLLGRSCRAADVAVWAWCPMPVHVHLIMAPGDRNGLRRALAKVHRAHGGMVHAGQRRSGHFWQGRFGAVAMGEALLVAAWR